MQHFSDKFAAEIRKNNLQVASAYLTQYLDNAETVRERLYAEDKFGMLMLMNREFEKAANLMLRISQEYKDNFGEDDIMYIHSVTNLGNILKEGGEFEQALPYFEQAIAMRKKTGLDMENIIFILFSAAQICSSLNMDEQAEQYYGEAISCSEQKYGKDDPYVGTLLTHQNRVLEKQCKFEQAMKNYERLIPILEKELGEGSTEI